MASKPKPTAAPYYLVAENMAHAKNEAEHERGWKRDGKGWVDAAGNHVEFTALLAKLKACKGARVYLGYKWYAAIAPHLMAELERNGNIVRVPGNQGIAGTS